MKQKWKTGGVILVVVAMVAVFVVWGGFYRVGQGEEALVLTFGRVTATHGPGLYWHIPMVQEIISAYERSAQKKEVKKPTSQIQGRYHQRKN